MADFNLQEYTQSLGGMIDQDLQDLANQTDLSEGELAAVKEEIADRTRLGIEFDSGGLSHRV